MQSLFLKAHYPFEFIEAVINNGGGFYRLEIYVHEARRLGLQVRQACVNRSLVLSRVIADDLFLGLRHIKGLPLSTVEQILSEREKSGPYDNLRDLLQRVPLSTEQIYLLFRAGALAQLGSRQLVLDQAFSDYRAPTLGRQQTMFEQVLVESRPKLPSDWTVSDLYQEQYDAYGFLLGDVFTLVPRREQYPLRAKDLIDHGNREVEILGYYVVKKPVTTSDGMHMNYMTWYDQEGDFFDTVHLPDTLEHFPFRGVGIYLVVGRVKIDFGVATIRVKKMLGKTLQELINLQSES